jgi:predicted small integral membrane protein
MLTRLSKIALVAASALFLAIVVFNNITDYDSNFQFVRHVLNMSTTFPGNQGMWRAIDVPAVHHAFYASIIIWELAAAVIIGVGAWKLWVARGASAFVWQQAKQWAALGLTVSMLQWFVAFITVGGEWFLMWQSKVWNGQDAAFRMFAILGLILLFLQQRDDEVSA